MSHRLLLAALLLFGFVPPSILSSQSTVGGFTIGKQKDPFTDEDRSAIIHFGASRSFSLGWKCMESGLQVLVVGKYMGGDRANRVQVRHRFDANPPSGDQLWGLTADHKAAGMAWEYNAIFTRQALAAKQLVIRVTDPLDNEIQTNTFELDGLRRALGELPCAQEILKATP